MMLLIHEAGKTLDNAQADLREAVDFLRYYAKGRASEFSAPVDLPGPTGESNQLSLQGRGIFACISPWNFPLAIFTGQVSAALAAGNAVLAKPAEQTPLIAAEAVRLLHRAGVPAEILHLLPGDGARIGGRALPTGGSSGVAFTGSNETAAIINRSLAGRSGPIIAVHRRNGRHERDDRRFLRPARAGGARCRPIGFRQRRPTLLGGPHSVRPGRHRRPADRRCSKAPWRS